MVPPDQYRQQQTTNNTLRKTSADIHNQAIYRPIPAELASKYFAINRVITGDAKIMANIVNFVNTCRRRPVICDRTRFWSRGFGYPGQP
jgi:hypothetical protein